MTKNKSKVFESKKEKVKDDKHTENVANEEAVNSEAGKNGSENLSEPANDQTDEVTAEETKAAEGSEKKKEEDYEAQVKELQDKYMRLMAEFDNFRKRTLKERMELIKTAGEDILLNIIPVVDDFERGLQVMEKSTDVESVKQGVVLIYNKFKEFLNQRGVKEIEAAQQEFNVDLHEAITKIPAPEENLKGKVVDVIQKGYILNEKVIRFAKVVVGE